MKKALTEHNKQNQTLGSFGIGIMTGREWSDETKIECPPCWGWILESWDLVISGSSSKTKTSNIHQNHVIVKWKQQTCSAIVISVSRLKFHSNSNNLLSELKRELLKCICVPLPDGKDPWLSSLLGVVVKPVIVKPVFWGKKCTWKMSNLYGWFHWIINKVNNTCWKIYFQYFCAYLSRIPIILELTVRVYAWGRMDFIACFCL